jgi:O-antigen/teichoic acid export membrane protein
VLILVAVFSSKTIETFLLNAWTGAEAVGFFLIAVALTKGGIELLSSGLNSVLMSHMAHAYGSDGEAAVNRVLSDNVRYFHFLGLMLAGVGYFWAPAVIALMYGEKYLPVVPALQMLIVAGGIALTDGVFGARLSTTGSQKTRALIVTATLVFSAVLALSLVPTYGLTGAAISSALTTVVGFLVIAIYTVTRSSVHLPYASIVQMVVIAAAAAAISFAVTLWNPGIIAHVIAGFIFALAYVIASLFTRTWTLDDLHGISRLTRKIPGLRNRNLNLERWARKS